MLKFIVIADLHLVGEGAVSHGLDTFERARETLAFIEAVHADAAFVVLAGDLADRGEAGAYRQLAALLEPFSLPCYLTLGNHDDRAAFLEVFADRQPEVTGRLDHAIDRDGHRVIVLDSCQAGQSAGSLEAAQLDWLAAQLGGAMTMPVIVVVHHNMAPLQTPLDVIRLDCGPQLADILAGHPDIRQVISGHVHMSAAGVYRGIPFTTLSGCHYSIEPTLASRSGPTAAGVRRREGPAQIAVVLSDAEATVVHHENAIDRHLVMAPGLFRHAR